MGLFNHCIVDADLIYIYLLFYITSKRQMNLKPIKSIKLFDLILHTNLICPP